MSKQVSWLVTDHNVTVNYDGQTYMVKRTDALADRLIAAAKAQDLEALPSLVSAAKRIETYSDGKFLVRDGLVIVNGVEAPQVLSNKIVKFANDGLPYEPLIKFAENLQANPSHRAINELFQFLEKNDHPITEAGNLIAYKRVKSDFKDIHSGTFDNSVGKIVEMPRDQVDEDPTRTCSNGLHLANWHYSHTQFGSSNKETDVMLEVEVNPADVVSIPIDYSNAKMRVCRYKVLGVVTQPYEAETYLRSTESDDKILED